MMRRAANNVHSWRWASQVRTKQSKWLQENLQDIEEKAQYALKLLEDEGESFAKRAEMYYKRRPELISFVEEAFKAYRALAERYDHISKELQNANTTIASVCPDQLPELGTGEDDAILPARFPKNPTTDMSETFFAAATKFQTRRSPRGSDASSGKKSGLSKADAVEEVDRLQKEILGLQTEKEFVKSSCESGLERYWEIENSIMEKQERVCNLQDEFDAGGVIDDEEAQRLINTAALKSCEEKLAALQETHTRLAKEATAEGRRIQESKAEYASLNGGLIGDGGEKGNGDLVKLKNELESSGDKMSKDLTETDMAEKIDELVEIVISLERLVSSLAALIQRLRGEIDDLREQIRALQEDKTVSGNKLREVEEKLKSVQELDRMVKEQTKNLEIDLTEARNKLTYLSEKLSSLKPEREVEKATYAPISDEKSFTADQKESFKSSHTAKIEIDDAGEANELKGEAKQAPYQSSGIEEEPFLKGLLSHGEEDREKLLLMEYTKVLRNYEEIKRKLGEKDNENIMKNEEIKFLRQKLSLVQKGDDDGDLHDLRDTDNQQNSLFTLIRKADNIENGITDQSKSKLANEQQFRTSIDALLGENLDLLVRFSNSLGQIEKFDSGIKDLQSEVSKIKKQNKENGGTVAKDKLRSNVLPIYKQLGEIHTELSVWLDKGWLLMEEINSRSSYLCNIQDEITETLKANSQEMEMKFTIYQAAQFLGEISNMKKENIRITDELQEALNRITLLKLETDKTMEKLDAEFALSDSKNLSDAQHPIGKSHIPLKSFIYDAKPKKQKLSCFSCIQPSLSKKTRSDSK